MKVAVSRILARRIKSELDAPYSGNTEAEEGV